MVWPLFQTGIEGIGLEPFRSKVPTLGTDTVL
jgi:hypothetical protein